MRYLVMAALLALSAPSFAGPRPAVVELFTSQGCSSCPPAEAYVGKLTKRTDVIALAFHVTYWDDLGWRDRFALTEAVDRQNVYAQELSQCFCLYAAADCRRVERHSRYQPPVGSRC